MAKIYPSLEVIENLKPAPTEGEWKLLNFLSENYNDEYEVFFQPFLNEARPDIVVMRKGGGVVIFEVKDWDLNNYSSTPSGTWIVKANGSKMHNTPIRQVVSYKEKLYSINSEKLLRLRTINGVKKCWSLVSCAVFFHKSVQATVEQLCFPEHITAKNENFIKHIGLFADDSLTKSRMDMFFNRAYLSRSSYFFSDDIYDDLHWILKPDVHTIEQGIKYNLSEAQRKLAISVAGERKRIKGVAGAGKSFVLARRAVNAHKRTNGAVLILTYNITLKNYLHDRISEVRETFDWGNFHIENYHQLFGMMLDECNLSIKSIAQEKWPMLYRTNTEDEDESLEVSLSEEQLDEIYADQNIFKGHEDEIRKYDVILIDEAQDYEEAWIRIIMQYVAAEGAEIVAFADEKQNVYQREVDRDKFPIIPITRGPWDRSLNTTYRLNTDIAKLAVGFQERYFAQRYVIDKKIEPARQLELIFDRAHIEYHYLSTYLGDAHMVNMAHYIRDVMRHHQLHPNDVAVLAPNVDLIRKLANAYTKEFHYAVNCMCETQDEYDKIKDRCKTEKDRCKTEQELKMELKNVRRYKKQNFWQNKGAVSFSSIHSFKGLESPAVVLLVGNEDASRAPDRLISTQQELMYVGLTRARNYLFHTKFWRCSIQRLFLLKAS